MGLRIRKINESERGYFRKVNYIAFYYLKYSIFLFNQITYYSYVNNKVSKY